MHGHIIAIYNNAGAVKTIKIRDNIDVIEILLLNSEQKFKKDFHFLRFWHVTNNSLNH